MSVITHLSPHPLGTVVIEEVVPLIPRRITSVVIVVVKTHKADRRILRRPAVRPPEGVAADHTKTIGEGVDLAVSAGEVVGVDVGNRDGFVRLCDGLVIVQLRNPVVGEVDRDRCGGALGPTSRVVRHGLVKVAAAGNAVDVT